MRTLDELIAAYIRMRDEKKRREEEFRLSMEPLNLALERLETHFLQHMLDNNVTSFATVNGTAYKSPQVSVTVADWPAFFSWAQTQDQLGMIVHGANKAAVAAYVEETEEVPPGLNFSKAWRANVRRSQGG